MARSDEGKIQDAIVKYLKDYQKEYKLIYDKREAGGFAYKEGQADVWVTLPHGMHIEFEIKTPWGELRTAQIKWINEMRRMDIPCYVVTSLSEFKAILEPLLTLV